MGIRAMAMGMRGLPRGRIPIGPIFRGRGFPPPIMASIPIMHPISLSKATKGDSTGKTTLQTTTGTPAWAHCRRQGWTGFRARETSDPPYDDSATKAKSTTSSVAIDLISIKTLIMFFFFFFWSFLSLIVHFFIFLK